jgi:hypothetical protein
MARSKEMEFGGIMALEEQGKHPDAISPWNMHLTPDFTKHG